MVVFLLIILGGLLCPPPENSIPPSSFPLTNPLDKQTETVTDSTLPDSGLLEFRGIDFVPFPNSYSTRKAFESLEELVNIPEINYIQLRFFLHQDPLESDRMIYDEGQDNILAFLIQRIHKSGKKVSLMPQLYVYSVEYVANLIPKNKPMWFESYSEALLHYAQIAEANNVEIFSIGNEMTSIFTYDTEWSKIIDAIRKVYSGNLTVKLNCWYKDTQFNNLLKIRWLRKLDYIGIAAYFDLTDTLNPTEQDLKKAWVSSRQGLNIVQDLEILHKTCNKPIIFSEIGYRSVDGCNIEPWNADRLSKRTIMRQSYAPNPFLVYLNRKIGGRELLV